MKLEIEFNTMEELATKALELSDALIRQVKVPGQNVFETIKENKGDWTPGGGSTDDALTATHVAPIAPEPETVQTQAVPTAPVPTTPVQETPAVPTTPVTYTMDQLSKAATDLVTANPAMTPQIQGLLPKYGVVAMPELKPEQYQAFAMDLLSLGAVL